MYFVLFLLGKSVVWYVWPLALDRVPLRLAEAHHMLRMVYVVYADRPVHDFPSVCVCVGLGYIILLVRRASMASLNDTETKGT